MPDLNWHQRPPDLSKSTNFAGYGKKYIHLYLSTTGFPAKIAKNVEYSSYYGSVV